MSDSNNFDNNQEQNSAPNVSKISLDELNEIKKSIAPIHSKNEEEILFANPDIDPNTVYSSYKKVDDSVSQNTEENETVNEQTTDGTDTIVNQQQSQVENQIQESQQAVVEDSIQSESHENDNNLSFKDLMDSLKADFDRIQNSVEDDVVVENNEYIENTQESITNQSQNEGIESQEINYTQENQTNEVVETDNSLDIQENVETNDNKVTEVIKPKKTLFGGLFGKKNKVVDTSTIPSDNTSALKAEAEAPKTEKINLSELQAAKESMKQEQDSNSQNRRPSISEIVSAINKKDEPAEDVEAGEDGGVYDKTLDFERVTDIKKYKLPLPKLPFILAACFMLLVGLGVAIGFIINNNKKHEVYVVDTVLNIKEITGGYVGETVDLSGVYITTTYSDGTYTVINDIVNYISDTSSQINEDNLEIVAANNSSWIMFNAGGKRLTLTIKTLDKRPSEFSDLKLTVDKLNINDVLSFDQILAKVVCGEYGTKLLSVEDIKNNLDISFHGVKLVKNETGFVLSSLSQDAVSIDELVFSYSESGKTINKNVSIDIVE